MTRSQHEATRARRAGEAEFLIAYGWKREGAVSDTNPRWCHPNAPKLKLSYTQKDALNLTDGEPLRYGGPR
jgi:hypothetical protein